VWGGGNQLDHNDFVDNGTFATYWNWQRGQATDYPGGNAWDDGRQGNYWSDYGGLDNNGDGVGDSPYVIPGQGLDRYPLMAPAW